MTSYDQIVSVEITTDQVLMLLARTTTAIAECEAHAKMLEEEGNEDGVEEFEDTLSILYSLRNNFNHARRKIEETWTK